MRDDLGSEALKVLRRLGGFFVSALRWTGLLIQKAGMNFLVWLFKIAGIVWRRFIRHADRPDFSNRPPLLVRLLRTQRKMERLDTTGQRTLPHRPMRLMPEYPQFHKLRVNSYINVPLSKLIWKRPLQILLMAFTIMLMLVTWVFWQHPTVAWAWLVELFLAWCNWQYLEAYWFVTVYDARKDRIFWTVGVFRPVSRALGSEDILDVEEHSYWWAILLHIDVGWLLIKTEGDRDNLHIPMVGGVTRVAEIFQGVDRQGGQQIQQELMGLIIQLLTTNSSSKTRIDEILGEGTYDGWLADADSAEAVLAFLGGPRPRP